MDLLKQAHFSKTSARHLRGRGWGYKTGNGPLVKVGVGGRGLGFHFTGPQGIGRPLESSGASPGPSFGDSVRGLEIRRRALQTVGFHSSNI